MGRSEAIARSIVRAIEEQPEQQRRKLIRRLISPFLTFFRLFNLPLKRLCPDLFASLRVERWATSDDDYVRSFSAGPDAKPEDALSLIGDMGYSGSTFFSTQDRRWLVKSVPRYFEHSFFRDDMMQPYAEHMSEHASSLLIRICDFLASSYYPLGSLLNLAPTHHIIMENILYGQEHAESVDGAEWTNWDLKPTSYFFPERDVASGRLASEATKSRLADKFEDKILLSQEHADQFLKQLETDTKFLADSNAVDYSLFLVRIKPEQADPFADPDSSVAASMVPKLPPFTPPDAPSWRTGIPSADGDYIFRAAILDFFWAKHKIQPMVMTGLISLYNLVISRQGHMSITTSPEEYRERFLKMCREIVEVQEDR